MSRQFTTSPQYVDFGVTSALQGLSEFTISVWHQTSTLTSSGGGGGLRDIVVIEDTTSVANTTWIVRFNPAAARFEFFVGIGGTNYGPAHSTITVATNTWYNIVCQYDASNSDQLFMFIGGSSQSAGSTPGGITNSSTLSLRVGDGNPDTSRQSLGLIGEVAFWTSILTAGDITNLAAGSSPEAIEPSSLIFYSRLQGTQSPEPCLVGAYSGTLTGSPTQGANPPVNDPTQSTSVQEVRQGPPMRGAPWVQFIRVEPAVQLTPATSPPVIVPQAYAPEIHAGPPMRNAPWFHYTAPVFNYNPPVPNAAFLQKYAPEVVHGPPIRGAPFATRLFTPPENLLRQAPPPPAVVGTPAQSAAEVHSGPFPAPWNGPGVGRVTPTQGYGVPRGPYQPPPAPPVPPSPPTGGFASTNKQLIPLVPGQDQRSTKASQIISESLNSLQLKGQLYKTGTNTWTINAQPVVSDRPPTKTDDMSAFITPGTVWVDTTNGVSYVNISNAVGAAVWQQIAGRTSPAPPPSGLTGTYSSSFP